MILSDWSIDTDDSMILIPNIHFISLLRTWQITSSNFLVIPITGVRTVNRTYPKPKHVRLVFWSLDSKSVWSCKAAPHTPLILLLNTGTPSRSRMTWIWSSGCIIQEPKNRSEVTSCIVFHCIIQSFYLGKCGSVWSLWAVLVNFSQSCFIQIGETVFE